MTTVVCSAGSFKGNDLESGLIEFRGIQFATAERFEVPVDILRYDDVVDALAFGPQSPQAPVSWKKFSTQSRYLLTRIVSI